MSKLVAQNFKHTSFGWIPAEWDMYHLEDVADSIQDGTHFSPKSKNGPFRYLTSKNIRFGRLDLSKCNFISAEEHEQIYQRCPVKKGDILLTKDGAKTGNGAINTLEEPFSLLSSVAAIRVNPQKASNTYVLQALLSPQGQALIKDSMSGLAITRLTVETIRKLQIPVP